MKTLALSVFAALSISTAFANEGRPVVVCDRTPFSDLTRIVIQETDLKGQYQIVETLYDSATKKSSHTYSAVFGEKEFEKSEFPALTSWHGYTRNLVRFGRDHYAIEYRDECGGGISTASCKETF